MPGRAWPAIDSPMAAPPGTWPNLQQFRAISATLCRVFLALPCSAWPRSLRDRAVALLLLTLPGTAAGGRRQPPRAQAATTVTTTPAATTTTARRARRLGDTQAIRPTPGNLLSVTTGDFGSQRIRPPLGGAEVGRGRCLAAALGGLSPADQRSTSRHGPAGRRPTEGWHHGRSRVKGLRRRPVSSWPCAKVDGGRQVPADQAGYTLDSVAGSSWRSSPLPHAPGSSLALEVVGPRPGRRRPPAGRRDQPPDQ